MTTHATLQYTHRSTLALLLSVTWCIVELRDCPAAEPTPIPTIVEGTNFTNQPPKDWSNIILFVEGALGSGDVDDAGRSAKHYTKLFNLVILADVTKGDANVHRLNKIGVGFTTKIKGRNTVITMASEERLGAGLNTIGRMVFEANERSLSEIKRIERSKNHILFDAPTMMLHKGEHEKMMVRYLVWVAQQTGRISTFVWLLDNPQDNRNYAIIEPTLQLLPENMRENRIMNVMGDRINFLGIPSEDAFALVRIPQGKPIKFTPRLQKVAGLRSFGEDNFLELLRALKEAVQLTPAQRKLAP